MNARIIKAILSCALVGAVWLAPGARASASGSEAEVCSVPSEVVPAAANTCDEDQCQEECSRGGGYAGGSCEDGVCECYGCEPVSCDYSCQAQRWDGGSCVEDACVCWG